MLTPRTKSLLKLALLVLFLASAFWIVRTTDLGKNLQVETIRTWAEDVNPLVVPLIYIAAYIVGTVMLVPGTLLSFVGAVLFGAYLGTLYTWIGATIGATLSFLLAKSLGRDFVDQLLGGRFAEFERHLEKNGFTSLLILRLLPWFPFTGINFGSGLTRIRLRDYVLATAIGILPGTFVYQFLFAALGDRMLSNDWQWSELADWKVGVAIGLFVVFAWFGRWLAKRMQQADREPPQE